jgi:hypothetical protein
MFSYKENIDEELKKNKKILDYNYLEIVKKMMELVAIMGTEIEYL